MEIDESELYHRRGSIHDELSQMDSMKSRSSRVKQRNLSLADRAPPVFSLTSFTEPGNTSTLFPGVNPQKVANSEEEVDKEIDRFLDEDSTAGDDVADNSFSHKDSVGRLQKRRMTLFDHQLLEFRHSETAKTSIKQKMQRLSSYLFAMAVLAVGLAIADLELSYSFQYNISLFVNASSVLNDTTLRIGSRSAGSAGIGLKTCVTLVSFVTCGLLYAYFHQHCRFLIVKHCLPKGASVFTSPGLMNFFMEFALCIFHLPPVADHFLPNELQLLVFLRLYLVARYTREHNHMAFSKSTRFLASVLQTELGSGFLVKTFFIKWPFAMIAIFYCLNLFGVGYLVFAIDRAFSPLQHNSLLDSIWMQVVTMTTLGFGDVTPESVLARAFVGMSSVLGIFLMALLISVIHESLQMSQQEKRILAYVERQDLVDRVKHQAACCIQATWRLYLFKRSGYDSSPRLRRILQLAKFRDTKKRLVKELFSVLNRWRAIRKSNSQDDGWTKDFVADNTAIMLTDVSRRVEQMDTILKRSLGIEEDDDGDAIEQKLCQQRMGQTTSRQPESTQLDCVLPSDQESVQWKKASNEDSDGISTETVLHHLTDLGAGLEESYNRTMTEFQALQSLIMARTSTEGAVATHGNDFSS
ncbi:small conductance calcium-activated potassium channel protein 2-like isoform X2 [Asterias amurensis]